MWIPTGTNQKCPAYQGVHADQLMWLYLRVQCFVTKSLAIRTRFIQEWFRSIWILTGFKLPAGSGV